MPRTRGRLSALLAALTLFAPPSCAAEPAAPPPHPWASGPAPSWQWQLSGTPDVDVDAEVFVLDPFATTADVTDRLRARNRRLICSVEVGTYDPRRPDASRFPADVLGAPAGGDRRWLDIRRWDVLAPIVEDRFRLCLGKRFEAVAPLDADGHLHRSGFPLSFDDQLVANRRVAAMARSLGLTVGLVNNLPQVTALAPDFDFAINEECVRLGQCDRLRPFVAAGKPVFHVEYTGDTGDFCVTSRGLGFASMRKDRSLGVWREPCLR
ncbi:endo alpha-1,4 polygalactosaminidase [Plantactinospora sp. GCM10030261]|uniref:endo alpha-1,4 polygalactosaminidase n=1 Tax=Plantactinospora sp. GCM10030261 TaxID=3273420 RepID=UPI003618BEB4